MKKSVNKMWLIIINKIKIIEYLSLIKYNFPFKLCRVLLNKTFKKKNVKLKKELLFLIHLFQKKMNLL